MITKHNLCIRCYEPITNPVCTKCHLREIDAWLRDKKINSMMRAVVLKSIKNSVPEEALNENNCILCNKEDLSACSYCFFLISARVLRELNFGQELVTDFLETFNYQLGHSEYAI